MTKNDLLAIRPDLINVRCVSFGLKFDPKAMAESAIEIYK